MRAVYTTLMIAGSLFSMGAIASTEQDVQYLINQMHQSDCVFVRNGHRHSGEEAAKHLTRKWDYAKDDITSTQVFIDEVASKSWFTGTPYHVICQGQQDTSANWLTQQLKLR